MPPGLQTRLISRSAPTGSGEVLQHLVRVHDVERVVGEVERVQVGGAELDVRRARLSRSALAASIDVGRGVDADHAPGCDPAREVERDRARTAADVEDRRARRRGGGAGRPRSSRRCATGASGAPPRGGRGCSGRAARQACGVGYGPWLSPTSEDGSRPTFEPVLDAFADELRHARRGRRGGVRVRRRSTGRRPLGRRSPTRRPAGRGRPTRSCSCTRRRRASRRCAPTC